MADRYYLIKDSVTRLQVASEIIATVKATAMSGTTYLLGLDQIMLDIKKAQQQLKDGKDS